MRAAMVVLICSAALSGPRFVRSPERLALQPPRAGSRINPNLWGARLETTKGVIVIAVHRDWAPHGADRFHELVTAGYFDDNRFFRVVKGQWAQFGINGDPKVSTRWRANTIPDDPPKQSNVRGRVAFAFKDPDGRTTQVYIALKDLSGGGNEYLDREFPRLDRLLKATVMR